MLTWTELTSLAEDSGGGFWSRRRPWRNRLFCICRRVLLAQCIMGPFTNQAKTKVGIQDRTRSSSRHNSLNQRLSQSHSRGQNQLSQATTRTNTMNATPVILIWNYKETDHLTSELISSASHRAQIQMPEAEMTGVLVPGLALDERWCNHSPLGATA